MPAEQQFDGQSPVSGYTLFHGKDGKSYYLKEGLSDSDITQRVQQLRGTAQSSGVDVGELQRRTLQQARATAARPIVSGELNNPASPNFNRSMPGSFEGHPENVGEYIPASAGEMAGGTADIASGNVARGTHRIIGGASNALLPVLPFAGAAAPVATARILAGGQLGSMAGKSIGEGIGLTPDQSDVAGDIGGLAAGYGAAKIPAARAAIARQLYTPDQAFRSCPAFS